MGNQGGVIHNQSDTQIAYMLHQTQIPPSKYDQIRLALQEQRRKQGYYVPEKLPYNVDCIYKCRAYSITTVGLQQIDFNTRKFISILWLRQGKNQWLIKSGKISSEESICIRIGQDGSYTQMARRDAQQQRGLSRGVTNELGKCGICHSPTKFKEFQQGIHCKQCSKKFDEMWICGVNPIQHSFCEQCSQYLLKSSKFIQNTKEQNPSSKNVKKTNTQVEAKIISKKEIKTELNTSILQKKNKNAQEKIQTQKREQILRRQENKAGFQKRKLEKIKSLTEGTTLKSAECPQCQKAKADLKMYQGERLCKVCRKNVNKLWVCCSEPIRHHCCQECYEELIKQAEYQKKKVQS